MKRFRRYAWNRPSQLSTPKTVNVSIKPRHTFGPKISSVVLQRQAISQSTRILIFPWRYSLLRLEPSEATLEPGSQHGFLHYIVITSRKARVVSQSCHEYSSKTQAIEQCVIRKVITQSEGTLFRHHL